ncbi:adenosylmethionine--8-amino-7-oxononanoate transaminase [Sulfurospirillum arcachonense]|uniref:adenosylmethionine--8-amino-7-oxononanoate transaminase n=1 Tax=Sulfurospirillum arcachonense TaxID=57666 RepID=UPI0004BAC4A7|nr:adenosylmethionine--8-amino-7-oxononanoate transaminase [Sulfurospirillum arcachonense]
MNKISENLTKKDLEHIWHPCTQMKDYEKLPLIPIKKGKGVYLYDYEDNKYIDSISSWWVNMFGHANEYINQKLKEQVDALEHVILTCFTHEPIIDLSRRLVEVTPKGLNRVFYADNGSSAVEVALKMSYQYYVNKGEKRTCFLSLENGYHGETIGALSVSDVGLYKDTFDHILLKTVQVPVPSDMSESSTCKAIDALEEVLKDKANQIAGFILEPLIQCAGNMHMYSPLYLTKARELCDKYDIHFIADEIAVGFGRTGTMFACEQAGITPDFMTLSKGLTGGYLPLSCVMTTDKIYDAFYCDYNENKAFLHSHSYTGNPLACSVANATLDIFENDDVINENKKKSAYIAQKLEKFKELKNIASIRQTGMVAAMDIIGYKPSDRIGLKVFDYALEQGVFLRPLGNVVYFMPPYVINYEEIDKMMDTAYQAIKSLNNG